MNDGLITFESVRDWEARECQRHICEIQGLSPFRSKHDEFVPETELVNLCVCERERVRDWEARECQRHICEIQGPVYSGAPIRGAGLVSVPKLTDLHRKPNMSTYA